MGSPVTVQEVLLALTLQPLFTAVPAFVNVVSVYPVIGEPFGVAALQDTTAIRAVAPATTLVIVGVDGTSFGITEPNTLDVALSPIALVAIPLIVYFTPVLNPLIVQINSTVVHDPTGVAPPPVYAL